MSFTYGGDHQHFPGSGLRAYFFNEHYRQISKAVTCEALEHQELQAPWGPLTSSAQVGTTRPRTRAALLPTCHLTASEKTESAALPSLWFFLKLGSIWSLQLLFMSNVPPWATLAISIKEKQLPGHRNTIHNANNSFLCISKNAWGFIGCNLGNIHHTIMQRKQWIFCFAESCSSWGAPMYSPSTTNLTDKEN